MTVAMIFGAVLQLVAIGSVVMCAIYLRRIAAAMAVRDLDPRGQRE